APNDPPCGNPLFTDTVPFSGNGGYASGDFTTAAAGTYRWIANYSGDSNNNPTSNGCNEANENVNVTPAHPTVTTQATATGVVGGAIHDAATVAGAFKDRTSVAYGLCGHAGATRADAICTDTATVNGNGQYVSGSFTTAAAGTYRWIANYSGDANNTATANGCNEDNENVDVTPASPSISTSATVGGQVGDTIHDVATVSGAF